MYICIYVEPARTKIRNAVNANNTCAHIYIYIYMHRVNPRAGMGSVLYRPNTTQQSLPA